MKIDGQIAWVTGGGSGLGKATASRLSNLGAEVYVLDFDHEKAEAAAKEIGAKPVFCDVSDEKSVAKVAGETPAPRIVVNCAGIGLAARIVGREGKLSTDVFHRTIQVNLLGTYNVMSYAARAMQGLEPVGDERGVIINTASVAFQDGQLGQAAYAASKGGIAALTLPAARELSAYGIRVMTIAPGLFYTPMMETLPPEVAEKIAADIPFPSRLGQADEYAQLAQSIIENSYLNGTTIRLDGAVRLPPR